MRSAGATQGDSKAPAGASGVERTRLVGRVQFRESSTPDGLLSRGAGWHPLRGRQVADLSEGDLLKEGIVGGSAQAFGVVVGARLVRLPDSWGLAKEQLNTLVLPTTAAMLWDCAWEESRRPSELLEVATVLGVAPEQVIAAGYPLAVYVSRFLAPHTTLARRALVLAARRMLDRRPSPAAIPAELPEVLQRLHLSRRGGRRDWSEFDAVGVILAFARLSASRLSIERVEELAALALRFHNLLLLRDPASGRPVTTRAYGLAKSYAALVRASIPLSSLCLAAARLLASRKPEGSS